MPIRPPVACVLKIDGRQVQTAVAPYFCEYGLWLSNKAIGAKQHFEIELKPSTLRRLLTQYKGQAFSVELHDYLGHVDEYLGYSAADMGPCSRSIASLKFSLAHGQRISTFRFEGFAGTVDPQSVYQGAPQSYQTTGYQFEIEFQISDADLPTYFVDAEALQAIKEYLHSDVSCGNDT